MMIYNKVTLAFPEEKEKLFRKNYFKESIVQVRVSFVLVSFLYGIFGYLDTIMFPEYANTFHIIRYAIVLPVFFMVIILSYTKIFSKIWQEALFVSTLVGGCGIIVMILLVPDNYAYYAGMMLIFSAAYFILRLRFLSATIACWIIMLIYNLSAIYYENSPVNIIINTNYFFISANLLGMFAAYSLEYYTRRNYYLNQALEKEKLHIVDINRNLEKTVRDRTKEMYFAKERAEESDRLKSAFLANMSHEIRTPMNGILGFSELLKNPELTSNQQQKYIKIIEKSGARMLNTINDIIDISKIESGLIKLDMTETDIQEKIEYIYSFFKPEIEAKGIEFNINNSLSKSESVIFTDSEKTYSILINLVKNAIKYTEKGSIDIGCYKKGDFLEIFVKDTGIGIPENRQDAIFERFVQADISDVMARQGSGLGLSISKAYAELMGGEIRLESEEGSGSTFYLSLPYDSGSQRLLNSQEELTSHNENVESNPEVFSLKILITEDDYVSEQFLEIAVGSFAKEIIKARTGFEAVEICRNNPDIDLILMDIRMPKMNGYEATKEIRKFNKNVIIISQTAFGLSGDREKSIAAGCNDYVSKPVSKDDLLALIQKHLQN